MNKQFNSELLQLARQFRGLSQSGLAKLSGVTQGYLSKLENALTEPSSDALEKLSDALNFPVSYFYGSERVYGLPISVHAYRKKARTTQGTLEYIQSEMNLRVIHYRRLLKSIDIESEFEVPYFDIEEYAGDAEKIAALVRRTWMIPNGPIRDLVEIIERAGVLIFLCDFPGNSVDGVTMAVKGIPACIFLNKNQPADRMRFSLAHELGHLVMHRQPSASMEDEANEFAAAFLMPQQDIFYALKNTSIQALAALKPIWRVSMAALLYRASKIGAIQKPQADYMWRQLSRLGYRLQEPAELEFEREVPMLAKDIIELHINDLNYSESQIQEVLGLSESDLTKLYQISSKSHLRLVK